MDNQKNIHVPAESSFPGSGKLQPLRQLEYQTTHMLQIYSDLFMSISALSHVIAGHRYPGYKNGGTFLC